MSKLKFVLCFVLVFILYSMPGYGDIQYIWNFGDGTSSDDEECPFHEYSTADEYDWTFTILQDGVPLCTPASGTICINYYQWNFGDGTTSNEKNPHHQYSEPGEYDWTFTYISCKGDICTTYGTITINDPPSIFTITSPNGGESILPYTTFDITWEQQVQEIVRNPLKIILMRYDDDLGMIADDVDPGSYTGTYPWTAATYDGGTADPGDGYKIKIVDSVTEQVLDISDAAFTISDQSVITVISPNGGEEWMPGSTENITWIASNISGPVKITLWQNVTTFKGAIAQDLAPLSNPYLWTVGRLMDDSWVDPGSGYTIKIEEQGTTVADISDASFIISPDPTVTVTAPNGGEIWPPGLTMNITWNYSNLTYGLKITLWKDGILQGTIKDNLDYISGSYTWNVGNYDGGTALGPGYTIKIEEIGTTVSDDSDASFSISSSLVKPDFNRDGVSDVIWRYNAPAGYNAVWLRQTGGGASAGTAAYPNKIDITGLQAFNYSRTGNIQTVDWESVEKGTQLIKDGFQGQTNQNTNVRPAVDHFSVDNNQNPGISRVMADPISDPRDDPQSVELIEMPDINWRLAGTGDFNQDGQLDIVWSNVGTAQNCVWYMNGTTKVGEAQLPNGSTADWVLGGVGDFNRDGYPDLMWHNEEDGRNGVWYLQNVQLIGIEVMTTGASVNWKLCGTGYFNNDDHVDLVWRNITNGDNAVWYMDGVEMTSVGWLDPVADQNWELHGTGDFNSDGKSDLIWRYMSDGDGRNCIWYLDGVIFTGADCLTTVTDTTWIIEN